MVKRIAANWINTRNCLLNNAMVEITDGIITGIVPFSEMQAEPAGTVFLNGTLTGAGGSHLYIGYDGKILLNNETIIQQ